ncbi:MAG: ATP-binding protein [bacterium]|nr:ATP-binding protein [bacterium]
MNDMQSSFSTLHLICGIPGVGKTTLAKQIESETGAIRMCPDEWIKEIWSLDAETTGNTFRGKIETLQWSISKQILKSGTDVIIEWGTWGKDERNRLRNEARALGSKVKLYYLHADKEVLIKRIVERNMNLGDHEFHMSEETLSIELDNAIASFQEPSSEEMGEYDA